MDKHRKTIPAAWTATPRRPGMRPVPCTHSPIVPPPIRHLASSRQLHASPPSSPRGVALCSCSGWLARSLMFCPRERGRRGGRARKTERKGEREIVGGNGWTRRGVGVPRKRKKESTVGGVGRERGTSTLRVSHVLLGANVVHRVLTYTCNRHSRKGMGLVRGLATMGRKRRGR